MRFLGAKQMKKSGGLILTVKEGKLHLLPFLIAFTLENS